MVRYCPKCKTSERNCRNIVMMINECGHPLCHNCVEHIFARNSNRCPYEGCGRTLRKNNFWEQIFDDPKIERENHIRKRLDKIYNLQQDDFSTLREYNDYLEHFEDIIFKLVNEIDVDEVEAEIQRFRDTNSELIERNRRRLTEDDVWINQMLDEEARRTKRINAEASDDKNGNGLTVNPKAIIDELRESNLPAEVVLDRQRKLQIEAEMAQKEEAMRKKRDKQERQRRFQTDGGISFAPIRRSGKAYVHETPQPAINGPRVPACDELEHDGYLNNVMSASESTVAGGYISQIGCTRAIFESFQDLLFV